MFRTKILPFFFLACTLYARHLDYEIRYRITYTWPGTSFAVVYEWATWPNRAFSSRYDPDVFPAAQP